VIRRWLLATTLLLFAGQAHAYLNATAAEIAVWQNRMVSGPYKTIGDVSTNSPGDWDRIVASKDDFKADPSADRYAGQTTNACVTPEGIAPPARNLARLLLEAAFYYLVNTGAGDREEVRTKVRDELLAQAGTAGTIYTNTSRWCPGDPYGPLIDENPGFDMSNWMTRLIFAYDYIRPTLSGGDQTTLDAWFLSWAQFTRPNIDGWLASARYPGRESDDYSSPTDQGVGSADFKKTHYDGWQSDGWIQAFGNNRGGAYVRYWALAGILFNDATLKTSAKRWFKEAIMFGTFADGTLSEMYRWEDDYPTLGWDYAALQIGELVTMADVFARSGDTELYEYSTSTGYNGTAGGPKSLGQMVTLFLSFVDGTLVRYGTETPGNNGVAAYKIDTIDGVSGDEYVDDTNIVHGNLYYRSAYNKSVYLRTASGAPAYPLGGGTSGGWTPFTGDWGTYPAMLFMYGQMEDNAANPFLEGEPPPPSGSGVLNLTVKRKVQ
jgi:hypothetical protein